MNVICLINDSWRWDHLGCYGNGWIKTPNLDAFAKDAAQFDWCYSEGLPTIPTRTTFFTGRYTFPFRGWQRLEPKDVLLAETLWNQGVTTALVADTYHMHKPSMAFERGFDYVDFIRGHEGDPWIVDKSLDVSSQVEAVHKPHKGDQAVKAQIEQYFRNIHWWQSEEDTFVARTLRAGAEWLERQKLRDRLFLWVDCFDPHEPWDPPEPYKSMYKDSNYKGQDIIQPIPGDGQYLTPEELQNIKNLYAGKCTLCDKWLGWFLNRVKELGMWDNTLIIFTTDHGEPFNEHGYLKKAEPGLYEELVHIPLLIRHPEGFGTGKRFKAMVETTEVFPTILDFFGVKIPGRIHGKSLLPMLRGEEDSIREYAYMGYFKQTWRISNQEWALQIYLDGKKPVELFNLTTDPGETTNLAEQEVERATAMELQLRKFVADLK